MEDNKPQEEELEPKRPKIIKKGGHDGHHGGAWKVAYADLVTAMMALFLVLWLVSQADTKLKEQIASYFKSPGVFTSSRGGILPGKSKVSKEPSKLSNDSVEQTLYGIAQQLQRKFEKDGKFSKLGEKVVVEVVEDGIQIEVLDKADNISFEVGSAILNNDALTILNEIAQVICTMPNMLKIAGHTDRRVFPSDNGYTNWELSTDRANAARRALVKACVNPKQISRVTGYADTDPIIKRDVYNPANRRISITVLRDPSIETAKEEDSDDSINLPDPGEDVISDKDDRLETNENANRARQKWADERKLSPLKRIGLDSCKDEEDAEEDRERSCQRKTEKRRANKGRTTR